MKYNIEYSGEIRNSRTDKRKGYEYCLECEQE